MANVIDRRPVDEAVATLLETVTGKPIGRSKAPSRNADEQDVAAPPYAILYSILGGDWWGPEWGAHEDAATLMYQVTSVGLREDQAQWMADLVRQALLGRNSSLQYEHALTPSGIFVLLREAGGPPGGSTREGKIWSVADTYSLKVSL